MLHKRYASPKTIIDRMIKAGRFHEFVSGVVKKNNEEADEKTMWEFYLHKVHDKSYEEFKNECRRKVVDTNINVDALVSDIRKGLRGFRMKK